MNPIGDRGGNASSQVLTLKSKTRTVTPKNSQREIMPRGKPMDQCIIRRCSGKQFTKGLCRCCYRAAQSLIGRNLTTWDELASLELTNEVTGAKFLYQFNRATDGRLESKTRKTK